MTTLSLFLLPTEELLAFEAKRKEAEENTRPPPEPVRARIPFTACLQAFTEPENVPDFWSSALQAKSAGVKSVLAGSTMTTAHSRSFIYLFILSVCVFFWPCRTSRFASFPEYLVVQIKKFTFGLDWVPKKLGSYLLDLQLTNSSCVVLQSSPIMRGLVLEVLHCQWLISPAGGSISPCLLTLTKVKRWFPLDSITKAKLSQYISEVNVVFI